VSGLVCGKDYLVSRSHRERSLLLLQLTIMHEVHITMRLYIVSCPKTSTSPVYIGAKTEVKPTDYR
jgi:hypothetical protein